MTAAFARLAAALAERSRLERELGAGGMATVYLAQEFLMARRPPGTEPRQVIIVTNWFQELARTPRRLRRAGCTTTSRPS